PNGWSPKTVMTLIHRLVKKGAVAYDKQGRAHLYRPKLRQSQCVRAQSRSFLDKVFRGATMPMLAQFLEDARLTPDQIHELKQILDKKSQ
ncbi:MAG: BlaI/MecI/CopY family transcriptional regulator, partial [Phycisphaeraceae bacterium]|nr:BlaI/MecI/CopY family transcriptional regulator [Phycisphaeraceae bacterium]